MEVLDATSLAERLKWEAKGYWLHFEAETPLEKYPAKQHARRVQEKLGIEEGLIYLSGQQARNNEDSDMPAPFRQLRYFYYLSGGPTLAEALVKYDVDEVYYSDEVSDYIIDWYHHSCNRGKLYTLHDPAKSPIGNHHAPIDSVSLQPAMNVARMIKDEHEIKLIRKANDISSKAHREVLSNILKFTNEAQVEGLFLDVCVSHQAKQQAYDPIAASGPNAGTLHYDANDEDFGKRQLMCLDAGCEYELYASDITRTFPLSSKWPSKEAANIYRLVERMQELCIKRLAPGVRYLDLHILAHQIAIDGLLALGILHNGTKEEIYKAGTSRAFFPHGLGHHIGLEVHDVGQAELMSVRRGKQVLEQSSHLEEGMIVTVEPGIYFSVYALQHFYLPSPVHSKYINLEVLNRYLPVGGVRIEDDILITAKSYENLTTAPKGDEMLEIIQRGRSNVNSIPARRQSGRTQITEDEPPLLRAPGISASTPQSILRPIARSSTMPAELKQDKSVDFEPFEGPSLFSNFRRSMTTDEKIQRWQQDHIPTTATRINLTPSSQYKSVCGSNTREVKHVYMISGSFPPGTARGALREQILPACKQCTILCETLDRLRQSLSMSKESPEAELDVSPVISQKQIRNRRSVSSTARHDLRGDRERPQHSPMTGLANGLSAMCLEPLNHVSESPTPSQRRAGGCTPHWRGQNRADQSGDDALRAAQETQILQSKPSVRSNPATDQLSAKAVSDVLLELQRQGPAAGSDRCTLGKQEGVEGIPAISRAKNFHVSTGGSMVGEARRAEE
ncbi:hypothetical protein SNOG_02267 [Parastagonospora nodorum SN15]|uniref:Probable Xaa-Pro aminopeptidase SNOG_02267 n=1 Tax=Phaeosphaeria nodorum (strain SN15 / ATCC MYA-4574 / FGSC 10173) TaxID=321614 RepID=AMPP2_PHANO|nr:hypothetical protein SNOG_02267 [Parastagonospora nodorum SN15]Q0V147.2 RecName: Full=Probable Xaa-Pro aminopeptidase SNOG_02267; AltName: Full=Aminoacylproline aminopeptidase; AltName: Full=Prolidase [Parastagonospora nodorum SN15]EAT90479.2 hypothetical protein SNOG_02267 [Parastagonospora nodorum SN15]